MNQLIPIELNEQQEPTVSGRMLHEFLEVSTRYNDWFNRMQEYGFEENVDFCSFSSKSTGGRPSTDHAITIDMAKELCMIQRTDKGKQARQYFIAIEKDYNSPEKLMARALRVADAQLKALQPYAEFGKGITTSDGGILIGEYAKILNNADIQIGQNKLFAWLRGNGYLIKEGERRNQPMQRYLEMGIFELKEKAVNIGDAKIIKFTTLITGKGQKYFIDKLRAYNG